MHFKDSDFIRGKVPITKEEVRAVSIAKLNLKKDSILLDIGAGTGSVAIESATQLENGHVYAIERNSEAVHLIKENIAKFSIENITLIEGYAPMDLPKITFDRMFIGGSGGEMGSILQYFLDNSMSDAILVVNAIALETLFSVKSLIESMDFCDLEISSVQVSRGKKVGDYTMMMGENPIYILSCKRG